MLKQLNKEGKLLLSIKENYDKTPEEFKEFVIEGLKDKKISNTILEIIKNENIDYLNEYLLRPKYLLTKEEYYIELGEVVYSIFEKELNYPYIQSFTEKDKNSRFVCIKKQLRLFSTQNSSFFKIPKENEEEFKSFGELYCKYRVPILINNITNNSINLKIREGLGKYNISTQMDGFCYYSDIMKSFNTDLIIKIPIKIIENNNLKEKIKIMKDILSYIMKIDEYINKEYVKKKGQS